MSNAALQSLSGKRFDWSSAVRLKEHALLSLVFFSFFPAE